MVDENEEQGLGFFQESFGDFLKKRREASGKTLEAVSRTTRIPKRFLQAFEENKTEQFPEEAFTRGFLRSYAVEIGLDVDEVLQRYDQLKRATMPTQIREIKKPQRDMVELGEGLPISRKNLMLGLGGIAVAFILVIVLWLVRKPGPQQPALDLTTLKEQEAALSAGNQIGAEVSNVIPAPQTVLTTPVTPSILTVKAVKKAKLGLRLDDHPAQEITFSEGETRSFSVFKEVELKTADKAAFQYQYNSKPLEISGPVMKLFNRHLFSSKEQKQ